MTRAIVVKECPRQQGVVLQRRVRQVQRLVIQRRQRTRQPPRMEYFRIGRVGEVHNRLQWLTTPLSTCRLASPKRPPIPRLVILKRPFRQTVRTTQQSSVTVGPEGNWAVDRDSVEFVDSVFAGASPQFVDVMPVHRTLRLRIRLGGPRIAVAISGSWFAVGPWLSHVTLKPKTTLSWVSPLFHSHIFRY